MRSRLLTIWMLIISLAIHAQVGTQFWFAAPELAKHSADMQLRLCLFADSLDADVTINSPSHSPSSIHLPAFSCQEIILAPNYDTYMRTLAVCHNQVMPRALNITSSAAISCYVQITGVNGETYTLKGENALGNEFVLAMQNRFRNYSSSTPTYTNAYASAQIIATEDSTHVDIYPTQLLFGDTTIVPRHIMLHRGEVYSIRAAGKSAKAHLTATRIMADKPVAVLTMDDSMSPYQKYFGEDAVAEQQVPVNLLGNEYIVISSGTKWEGVLVTDLSTDSTDFISMNGRQALYIHRDHPVQVFQLTGFGNEAGGTQLPNLVNSGSRRVLYSRPSDSRWTWMHILTPTTNIHALSLNGKPIDSSSFQPVPHKEDWSFATIDITRTSKGSMLIVESSNDIFQLSVVDASSATRNQQGKSIPTSCSVGYFSSYGAPKQLDVPQSPVLPDVPETGTDTVVEVPPVLVEIPIPTASQDTTVPPVRAHHLAVFMESGYSHMPFGNRDFQWGLGYGAGIGLLYQYERNHFLLNLGAGFLWQDVEHRSQTDQSTSYTDTHGSECTIMMRIRRFDRLRMGYIEVPLLLGGLWNGFYLLGGVKVGLPVLGNTQCEARLINYADYEQYFVPFSLMANHGLQTDVPVTCKDVRPSYVADTRVSLEMGLHMGKYRLGLFADYGVLWPKNDHDTTPWMQLTDPMEPATWQLHHPLASSISNGHYAQSLLTGIRFTIVLL